MDVKATVAALQGVTGATAHKMYFFKDSNAVANSGNLPLTTLTYQFDAGGYGQFAMHRYWIDAQGGENFYESIDGLRNRVQESSGSKIEFVC